jgi:proteasome activator subunit 4
MLENKEDCDIPPELRITDGMKTSFVLVIRPLVYMAMFGKDTVAVMSIQSALKNLSWIEPSLVVPGLLDRVYPSLESLSESHRTMASLGALYSNARALLTVKHYPEGGQHLMPLLNLILPAIDMNDPSKSSSALLFISLLCYYVPVIESPSVSTNSETEYEQIRRLNSLNYEDWITSFLSRVLSLVENLPDQHESSSNNKQTTENSLMDMVMVSFFFLIRF